MLTAVEPFAEFTSFIAKSGNISVLHTDLFNFNTDKRFDFITMFRIIHYFDESQAAFIYEKYAPLLKPG